MNVVQIVQIQDFIVDYEIYFMIETWFFLFFLTLHGRMYQQALQRTEKNLITQEGIT